MQIVDISKEFRLLIKQYLISRDEVDLESDDESISSEGIKKYDGMGILRFSSDTYIEDLAKCQASLVKLREKFEKHIKILSTNLNKLTKTQSGKIILSYLLEILQSLNFNSYYINREDEGLPPDGFNN